MRRIIGLLAVIMLTAPDGTPVWIETAHIQSIREPDGHCVKGSGALIRFAEGGTLCVTQTPYEISARSKE